MKVNILYIFTLCVILIGCKKKEPTTWSIDVKSPIAYTTLDLTNILNDSILIEQPDSSIILNYIYDFSPINTSDVFKVPDTTISAFYNLAVPGSVNLTPGFQFVNAPEENVFNLGDARITSLKVASGKIQYKITSQINEKTTYTYRILRSDDGNGSEFSETIIVPAGTPSSPGVTSGEFDVTGYSFDMTGSDGTDYNIFETKVEVLIDPNGSSVAVTKFDSIFIENSLINVTPKSVTGYLGMADFTENAGNTNFNALNKIVDGSININDVNISLDIINYVGADAQFTLNSFSSYNNRTTNNVSLTHSLINNPININRATKNGEQITPYKTSYLMTPNNSNIDLFIENLPTALNYSFEASFNPLGNISGYNDFLYIDNTIDLNFNIEMPLSLLANNLTLVDTLNLSIDSLLKVQKGKFELLAENGFPFDAKIQGYILNDQNQITDSIFDNQLIHSGIVNGSNIVTQSSKSTLFSNLNESKMNMLKKSPKIILKAIYNTQGSGHVDLYTHYKLNLKLIGDFEYLTTLR